MVFCTVGLCPRGFRTVDVCPVEILSGYRFSYDLA